MSHARLLSASVEIALAAGDTAAAGAAAGEPRVIAAELGSPFLRAHAARATGAVLLAEHDNTAALIQLRGAFNDYHALGVPYEAAQTRLLIAAACEALSDHDAAQLETSAARAMLESLGATTPSTITTRADTSCRRSHTTRASRSSPCSPRERRTARLLAGPYISARPSQAMSATSSPSSASDPARPQLPTRTTTTSCNPSATPRSVCNVRA